LQLSAVSFQPRLGLAGGQAAMINLTAAALNEATLLFT
jgi:hypothetical protein